MTSTELGTKIGVRLFGNHPKIIMSDYWKDRGYPWEYDPGPPRNRSWLRLFAETPNYRALGKAVMGKEKFRWHFGPMFYRGRLWDDDARVLVIGQEGAQDESLAHRSFSGGTGARMQYFLKHIGITESYLFLNTFVYPIFGQYVHDIKWLAQDLHSPVVQHRHDIFNYVAARNDLRLIIAVGTAAKESVVTWISSLGGPCAQGPTDISECDGTVIGPHTKLVGVRHPGGAAQGGSIAAIIADFKAAIQKIDSWAEQDPSWLPVDPEGVRLPAEDYKYRSAPIPFRDFPFGVAWRIGRGGTSSNRRDQQRSIQMFSKDGEYNGNASYSTSATGSEEGYAQEPGDLAYEPPRESYREFDRGPSSSFARLLMGGSSGFPWPDFMSLGVPAHESFGYGPIYRGRFDDIPMVILADQQSHDDLFTSRALTGDAGQHLQAFLNAMGLTESYLILRVLPVDTLDFSQTALNSILENPKVLALYAKVLDKVANRNDLKLALAIGPHSQKIATDVLPSGLTTISMKAFRQTDSQSSWQDALQQISTLDYPKDIANPTFQWSGERGQIPRHDLPFGTLRWQGSSGDRGRRGEVQGEATGNYYKITMPTWASKLKPEPLSAAQSSALQNAPNQ